MNIPRQRLGKASPLSMADGRLIAAFTLLELLVVISIIGLLAGLVVGLAPIAATKMREAKLKAELNELVTAIESYKARFGVYPPDNYDPATGRSNPVTNQLYYELTGVIVNNVGNSGYFRTADDNVLINTATVSQFFNREGFVNSATDDQRRRLFRHTFNASQHAQIFRQVGQPGYANLELLTAGFSSDAAGKKGSGFAWPLSLPAAVHPVPSNPGLNPWRYVSTNPTNNPGTFDLWAEIIVRNKKKIIGNWKQ